MDLVRAVLGAQGAMYVATGVWPLLHMRSFEAVTGPKTDDWLVYTVGLLLAVIGAVLLAAAARRAAENLIVALAIGTALALVAIEVVHVSSGTIARIYLRDPAIEAMFAALLAVAWQRQTSRSRPV